MASTSKVLLPPQQQSQEDIDIDKILNSEASLLNREEEVSFIFIFLNSSFLKNKINI